MTPRADQLKLKVILFFYHSALASVPAHEALRLVVNSRAGHRSDDRPAWKRPRGLPRQTWMRQLEIDVGLAADAAWNMAGDRDVWRVQRPIAGQAVQ